MSKAQYDIYRRKVFDLAKTLVVKSKAAAVAVNRGLKELGHVVNEADPTTWKYYLNLAGIYHHTDRSMTVRSLDTLQIIDFNRENLLLHLATAREYRYGSRYYNELLNRYPDQESLILGILNPIDLDHAIDAPDGSILYFDPTLVESNEANLIPELESWIQRMMKRWWTTAYAIADDLYVPTQLAILASMLPAQIMNIRLANCHTNYTHSFHIREYLASHGRLDEFIDSMTKRQMLWLYRNIRYLVRNAGKEETFQQLLGKVLTDRGFPLTAWEMQHNEETQVDDYLPTIEFVRNDLNFSVPNAGAVSRSVIEMLEAEEPAARRNADVIDDQEPETRFKLQTSRQNELKTKVLESSILDMTDAYQFTMTDILLNHWMYTAFNDRYSAVITVDNPKSGGTLSLSVREAFVTYVYLYAKSIGLELETIPTLNAALVRRPTLPTQEELRALAPKRVVSDTLITEILTDQPWYPTQFISTEAFYNFCSDVFDGVMRHRFIWSSQHDHATRGMSEAVALRLYADYPIEVGTGTYPVWFAERGLDMPQFEKLEAEIMAQALFETATGKNLNLKQSLKDLQAAMLRLMSRLSSYTVQYLQDINTVPIRVVDWSQISPGRPEGQLEDHDRAPVAVAQLISAKLMARHHTMGHLDTISVGLTQESELLHSDEMDLGLDIEPETIPEMYAAIPISNVTVLRTEGPPEELDEVDDRETEYYIPSDRRPLEEAFLTLRSPHYNLSVSDKATLLERWELWLADNPPHVDLGIVEPRLPGHVYPDWTPFDGDRVLPGIRYPKDVVLDPITLGELDLPNLPGIEDFELEILGPVIGLLPNRVGDFFPVPPVDDSEELPGFEPPRQIGDTLDEVDQSPMPQQADGVLDVVADSELPVQLPETDLPGFYLSLLLEGFEYLDLTENVTILPDLSGFEYIDLIAATDLQSSLNGFEYVDLFSADLDGFDYYDL